MQRPAAMVRPSRQLIASDLISIRAPGRKRAKIITVVVRTCFYDNQGTKHFTKGTYRFLIRIDQKKRCLV